MGVPKVDDGSRIADEDSDSEYEDLEYQNMKRAVHMVDQ